jgi:hypothetical protein
VNTPGRVQPGVVHPVATVGRVNEVQRQDSSRTRNGVLTDRDQSVLGEADTGIMSLVVYGSERIGSHNTVALLPIP